MNTALFCVLCNALVNLQQGICQNGHTIAEGLEVRSTEMFPQKEKVGVGIMPEESMSGFPHTCKKCGYEECEITDLGAQYADESNIYLYRCKKCQYVERQADGSGNS